MERKVWAPLVASVGKVKASRGVARGAANRTPLHAHSLWEATSSQTRRRPPPLGQGALGSRVEAVPRVWLQQHHPGLGSAA